jgi:hypothetical protein
MGVEVGSLLVTLTAPTSTSACTGISLVQCNLSVTTMSFGGVGKFQRLHLRGCRIDCFA